MGTWDTGPFDNDIAADFGGDLDEAAWEEREPTIRGVLVRAASLVSSVSTTASGQRPQLPWPSPSILTASRSV